MILHFKNILFLAFYGVNDIRQCSEERQESGVREGPRVGFKVWAGRSALGVKGLIMYSPQLLNTPKHKVGYVFISQGKTLQHSCEWLKESLGRPHLDN